MGDSATGMDTMIMAIVLLHRRRAQVDIFAQKYMYEKLTKCQNFTRYLPRKLSKCPIFVTIFARKVTKFPSFKRYLPEFFFRFFSWGHVARAPPAPVFYAYLLFCLQWMPLMDLAIELFAHPVSSVLCSSIPQLYYSYSIWSGSGDLGILNHLKFV